VLEVAGRRDHHVARVVVLGVEAGDRVAVHRGDGFGAPHDLAADRVRGEHRRREDVVDEVVGRVVAHADLFEDDLALGFDVVGAQCGRPHDVGEDVEREREPQVGDPHVIGGELLRGEGVHVAAHRLHFLGDLLRGAACGALEQEVLQEVAGTGECVGLVARAGADPEADGHGTQLGERLGHDPNTGVEARDADALRLGHRSPFVINATAVETGASEASDPWWQIGC
jgi:hypothetical protein